MRIVKNGDVHVSAPIGVSKKQVEAFIEENRGWIVEARLRLSEVEPMDSAVLAVEGIHLKGSISAVLPMVEDSVPSSKICLVGEHVRILLLVDALQDSVVAR